MRRMPKRSGAGKQQVLTKPVIAVALGDADYNYTGGRIVRLMKRAAQQLNCSFQAIVNDSQILKTITKTGVPVQYAELKLSPALEEARVASTAILIRETSHLVVPGSKLPLCKILGLDDFAGSMSLHGATHKGFINAQAVMIPMMGVDNNTKDSSALYLWAYWEAKRLGVPTISVEISPLGNKHLMGTLPTDYYITKTLWGKDFLVDHGVATNEQVFVLNQEETHLLTIGNEETSNAYLDKEEQVRQVLQIPVDRFVIVIPHHVGFIWEIKKLLQSLAAIEFPLSIIIKTDSHITRRQYTESQFVVQLYGPEFKNLKHVVIDEQVGMGLCLRLADVIVAPFAGTCTEWAQQHGKYTIITQACGENGWQRPFIYWEPDPQNVAGLLSAWCKEGLVGSGLHLSTIIARILS